MSKKIVFKGTPNGCFLPFEPDLLQLDLHEPNSTEPPSDSRTKQIEELAKLSIKETKDFCFDTFSENCVKFFVYGHVFAAEFRDLVETVATAALFLQ